MDAKVTKLRTKKDGMDTKPAKIIVVDDDPLTRQVIYDILSTHGYETTLFPSGEELVETVKKEGHTADLYLIDYEMPGMDGLTTVNALKQLTQDAVRTLPFALVTSHTEDEIAVAAGKIGALDYIHKPLNPSGMLAQVRVLLMRALERYNLTAESEENQFIKIATGILIERYQVHPAEAYELMRKKVRSARCKVAEIAAEIIISTGDHIDEGRKQLEP